MLSCPRAFKLSLNDNSRNNKENFVRGENNFAWINRKKVVFERMEFRSVGIKISRYKSLNITEG